MLNSERLHAIIYLCYILQLKTQLVYIKYFKNAYAGIVAACFDLLRNGNIKSHDKYLVFIAKWYTSTDASRPTSVPAIMCIAELRICKKVAKNMRVPLPANI